MPILSEDVIIRLLVDTQKGVADLQKAEAGTKNLAKTALKMAAAMGGAALAFELVVKAITSYIQYIKEAEKAAVTFAKEQGKALDDSVVAYEALNKAIEESKRIDGERHLEYMENHRTRRAARIEETNLVKQMTTEQFNRWRAENAGMARWNEDFQSRVDFMQEEIEKQRILDEIVAGKILQADLQRRLDEERAEAQKQDLEDEIIAVAALTTAWVDYDAIRLASYIESQHLISAAEQAAHALTMERIAAEKAARVEAANSMYTTLKDIVTTYYANEIAAAGDNEEELAKIREKQFKANQAFAVADTIINTAASIMKVLSQGGIFAIPIAAAMGVLGAAQLAVIGSAKPTAYATGTPPGGYVVPPGYEADNFPVSASSGETVTVSRPGQDSGQMVYNVINIDGYQFGEIITRLTKSGKATVASRAVVA